MDNQDSALDVEENKYKREEDLTTKVIGDFGKWQLLITFSMALLKLPIAWYHMNIIFLAPPQDFWCHTPELFLNSSGADRLEVSLAANTPLDHHCTMWDLSILGNTSTQNTSQVSKLMCENFVYDRSVFNRTIVSDWNLVCSKRWLVNLSQIVLMWGVLLGGILFGALADRFGRKYPLMAAIVIQSIAGFVSGLMTVFWGFIINRFILALATGGIAVIAFVLCMEVVSGKWRTVMPVFCQLLFGLGNVIMAGLAYWLRDWRNLEFSLGFMSSIFILYWFWIPESPRWLLASDKTEKALEVLRHAAFKNNRSFNINEVRRVIHLETQKKEKTLSFMTFLKSKNMRKKTLLLSLNWLCTGISFYTFSQYLGSLGSNIFLTVAISGIISTPGSMICIFVVAKLNRKTTIAGFQLLSGLCFVLLLAVPKILDWFRLLCAGVGLAGMAGSVPALYLFTAELYPTIGRNVGVGGVTIFARVGSMIAPLFLSLDEIMNNLTLIFLATMSLAQVLLLIPLPDTKDCPLPASLEEADKFTSCFRKDFLKEKTRRKTDSK